MSVAQRVRNAAFARLGTGSLPKGLRSREALDGYLFAAPAILGLLIFTAGPILYSFYLSFTQYNIIAPPKFIGLENFRTMFLDDDLFWLSLRVTLYYSALSVPLRSLSGCSSRCC